MRFFSVQFCRIWFFGLLAFDVLSMELPNKTDFGDIELVGRLFVKGPPKQLADIAAATLVRRIAVLSQINKKGARQELEGMLSKLPSDCEKYIEKALWNLYDPCSVRNSYKSPLVGAYDCSIGFAQWENTYSQIGFARWAMSSGGLSSALIEYDTGTQASLDDVIVTRVGSEEHKHCVDYDKKCVFSDDGRYCVFKTRPVEKARSHLLYTSIYDRENKSWKSVIASGDSASFFDSHRLIVRSETGVFSLIDCSPEAPTAHTLFSVSGQSYGGWSTLGDLIIRISGQIIFVYAQEDVDENSCWSCIRYPLPYGQSRWCAVAKRRSLLACSYLSQGDGRVSFLKITKDCCIELSKISIVGECTESTGFAVREFFSHEQLCAVEISARFLIVIIGCADIENPHIIKKFDGSISYPTSVIGQMLYSGDSVIMPNILVSYYAAYKKKLTQHKALPCIIS